MNTSDLVGCFYDEIWNCGNKAKIPELLHESFTFRGSLGQTKRGRDAFAEYGYLSEMLFQNTAAKYRKWFAKEAKYSLRFCFPEFIRRSFSVIRQPSGG